MLDEIGELGQVWQSCVTNIGGGIGGSVCVSIGLKHLIDSAVDEQDHRWKDSQPWSHLSKLLDFEITCLIYFRLEGLVFTEWRWAVWRGDRMDLHVHHESGMH